MLQKYTLPDVSFIRAVLYVIAQSLEHTARSCNIATIENLEKIMLLTNQ